MKKKNSVNDAEKSNKISIYPRTDKQREYLRALENHNQIFAIGPAGTGKTFLPVMVAVKKYLRGEIKKIIVTRPAVEVEESHGYLPGNITKKLAPWVLPITELMVEAMGKQRFLDMLASEDFEVAPFAYMRGRTFADAFVILDEAQNTSPKQMEMFLTRIGENSHVVVTGDMRQTDVAHGNSGLHMAISLISRYAIPAEIVRFERSDVVRSDICRAWVEAFEKET